ncbi:MAG: pyridoxamine 5'-phosphate oxidase family protein [Actinomycetales bacterium]|nr:pyridoxamine 5'-phosphate oxidase family protein [Actinomycetales bacterium]
MGKVLDGIDASLATWLQAQPVFFVATAPLAEDGHVNCSPKGLDGSFSVLDDHTVAYLDLTGSGVETIAHLRENGRIVLMFCAFEKRPRIIRLHGRGRVLVAGDAEFDELLPRFAERLGTRSIIVVDVERVADSCGYGVPAMAFEHDRDVLLLDHAKRGPEGLAEYHRTRNAQSIDALPGFPV